MEPLRLGSGLRALSSDGVVPSEGHGPTGAPAGVVPAEDHGPTGAPCEGEGRDEDGGEVVRLPALPGGPGYFTEPLRMVAGVPVLGPSPDSAAAASHPPDGTAPSDPGVVTAPTRRLDGTSAPDPHHDGYGIRARMNRR